MIDFSVFSRSAAARGSIISRPVSRSAIGNIVLVLNAIDAGRLDHLFVDAETKAAERADWMVKGEAVVRKYVRAYPGMFNETPDGKIGGLPEGANIPRLINTIIGADRGKAARARSDLNPNL